MIPNTNSIDALGSLWRDMPLGGSELTISPSTSFPGKKEIHFQYYQSQRPGFNKSDLSSRFIRLGNFLALIFVRRDQLPIKQFYGQLPDSEVDMEPVPNFLLDNTRFHHINSVVCGMRSNLYQVNIYITVRFFLKTIIMNSEIVFKKSYCINCCMHVGQKVRQKDINISMFH